MDNCLEILCDAIRTALRLLQDHDHEVVYGPQDYSDTCCVVPRTGVCEAMDVLEDALDLAGVRR